VSGWIKFEKDMANDPRLLELAVQMADAACLSSGNRDLPRQESVALYCNALRGALVTLWCYADTHIRDDDTLDMGAGAVEALVGIDNFCELLPQEWIEITEDGAVKLPGYCVKNGVISRRKRTQDSNERVRKFREKRNAVSNALPTHVKRNGNAHVTAEDQDQDQDQDIRERGNKASRASKRVPAEFAPDPAYASAELPDMDVAAEVAKFKDCEFKKPRSDWDATWRNWIRTCKESGRYARKEQTNWM
jgi:hypothetical protein